MQVQMDINECPLQCLNGDQWPYHNNNKRNKTLEKIKFYTKVFILDGNWEWRDG